MKKNRIWIVLFGVMVLISCKKTAFLEEKPTSQIVQPRTLTDFQQLLDNTEVLNYTGGLSQISADDQQVPFANYQLGSATERNAYIWNKEIYEGDVAIRDWNVLYQGIFYSNVVLEGLSKSNITSTPAGKNIKGWALFSRAYAFFDLTQNFCNTYDVGSASTDLGIPLRLSPGIDEILQRSTLQQSYDQILADALESLPLLQIERPTANLNRPSKVAAFAFLARVYLNMRNYTQAENYADKCLELYNTLVDYNTVNQTSATPFSPTNDELIYSSVQVATYSRTTGVSATSSAKVSPNLLSLYASNDLRLKVFYALGTDGTYTKKRGYNGSGVYHFTGLATDEIYLIKSECLARRNETKSAMDILNMLLIKRLSNTTPYVPIIANSASEALSQILLERRKELAWRGLRWQDIKRLNKEGANITLTRLLNGTNYILPTNDPRYVFPIPDDEISSSGIQQNKR